MSEERAIACASRPERSCTPAARSARRPKIRLIVLTLTAMGLASACGSGDYTKLVPAAQKSGSVVPSAATASPSPKAATDQDKQSPRPPENSADRAAFELEREGREAPGNDVFGGVMLFEDGTGIDLYLTQDDARLRATASRFLSVDKVAVHFVPMTYRRLEEVSAKVFEDSRAWAERGVDITSSGPDIVTNGVSVGVARLTPAAAALRDHYGRGLIQVSQLNAVGGAGVDKTSHTPSPQR